MNPHNANQSDITPKDRYYANIAATVIKGLNQRGMEGYFCPTPGEAVNLVKSLMPEGSSVAWGGSESLKECGIMDAIHNGGYVLYDRSSAVTPEEKAQMYAKHVTADFFLMSSNAITRDGELINIDGLGNRAACLMTGPKNVIVVAGMNKIAADRESGIKRASNIAAPPNCVRLSKATPCSEYGYCMNCHADGCICSHIVITRHSMIKNRIKVILVGCELGY